MGTRSGTRFHELALWSAPERVRCTFHWRMAVSSRFVDEWLRMSRASRTSGSRRLQLTSGERAHHGASPDSLSLIQKGKRTADLLQAVEARASVLFGFLFVLLFCLPPTHPFISHGASGAGRGDCPLGIPPRKDIHFRHRLLGGVPIWVTSSLTRGLMTSTHNPKFLGPNPKHHLPYSHLHPALRAPRVLGADGPSGGSCKLPISTTRSPSKSVV